MTDNQQPCGKLKFGNPTGPLFGPDWPGQRCTAKAKSTGVRCRCPAVRGYTVCRVHGARGGPKTEAGKRRIAEAQFKHGRYTREAIEERRKWKDLREAAGAPRHIFLGPRAPRPPQPRDERGRFV